MSGIIFAFVTLILGVKFVSKGFIRGGQVGRNKVLSLCSVMFLPVMKPTAIITGLVLLYALLGSALFLSAFMTASNHYIISLDIICLFTGIITILFKYIESANPLAAY